ncbi:MAG: YgcG family protein [Betaproteobacteria bacterium]|nr:MAG: YgcG family protein [Betaproteobacteria bacterium]
MRKLFSVALLLAPLLAGEGAIAEVAVPALSARVTDLAQTLTDEQRSQLESRLTQFEAQKGAQVGVLILPTTKPETIEQYAVRVQEEWQLGRAGVDDGVLLVVASEDRTVRIEVGYGLEGALPDAIAKRIIEEDIIPQFRNGDVYAGISAGVTRMMAVIEGEPLPPPQRKGRASQARINLDWLFPAFVLLLIGRQLLTAVFGRFVGAGLSGAMLGIIAWLVVGSLFVALLVAFLVFVFSLSSGIPGRRFYRPWGGGWSSGRGSSRGWSSGVFGGGFGGGGGFSGGGGASGRW